MLNGKCSLELGSQPIRALCDKGEQRKLRKQGPGNAQTDHEVSHRNCRRGHGAEQPFEERSPPLMFCRSSCDPVPANGNETSHYKQRRASHCMPPLCSVRSRSQVARVGGLLRRSATSCMSVPKCRN